jgi:predicted RNase H-like HicB family nuclease
MKKIIKDLQFKVLLEQDEDGIFVASVPAIPGCHTQGDTYEEVLINIKEAIELCLEEAKENDSYRQQIDWSETEGAKTRFLGVTEVPITFAFPS